MSNNCQIIAACFGQTCQVLSLHFKVVSKHEYTVRPSTSDINENLLSEQCRDAYHLTEDAIKCASSLDTVLDKFDSEVAAKLDSPFCLVTDGQLHIRQCLYPEAQRKGITLPAYYHRFYDLRKEVAAIHPDTSISNIEDMLKGECQLFPTK
jgi:epithelial splicing regulatory protein 1/2